MDIRDLQLNNWVARNTEEAFSLETKSKFFAVTSVSNLCWFRLALFPAILTYKYACNMTMVSFLRGWMLGNSPTALQNAILEMHSEEWMRKQLRYLDDWQQYR